MTLYVEYDATSALDEAIRCLRAGGANITDLEISHTSAAGEHPCAVLTVQMKREAGCDKLVEALSLLSGIAAVEEI